MTVLAAPDSNSAVLNIAILTPVWGERYISAFAEVGFPSLLSVHNLGKICERH
jgi:hypothetical protein